MVLKTCRYTTDMFGLNTGHCLHMCMICYVIVILTVRNVHWVRGVRFFNPALGE